MKIVIPGKPMAKQRPRLGKVGVYTPNPTLNYENFVKWCFKESSGKMLNGEIIVMIKAYFPVLKSVSKKQREKMLQDEIKPAKKPDLDNIAKIVLDSLNGLAYKDDSQVVKMQIEKYYSDSPRVEVYLKEREYEKQK